MIVSFAEIFGISRELIILVEFSFPVCGPRLGSIPAHNATGHVQR